MGLLLLAAPTERVLYRPGGGDLTFVSFPPFGKASLSDAGELITDGDRKELAGLFVTPLSPLPELDHKKGFSVELTLRLDKEVHRKSDDNHDGKEDRAGFSWIVLDQRSKGIELGFWKDRVWAQDDGKRLFSQAEGADADTTAEHRYELRFSGEQYHLWCDGKELLAGKVRDYTGFKGQPDVYHRANFIFLGDDSTRSGARAKLGKVILRVGPVNSPRRE